MGWPEAAADIGLIISITIIALAYFNKLHKFWHGSKPDNNEVKVGHIIPPEIEYLRPLEAQLFCAILEKRFDWLLVGTTSEEPKAGAAAVGTLVTLLFELKERASK